MDYSAKWSTEATEDLESIADYIARDSEFYARSVVSKILAISRKISEQPMIGRIVPEISEKEIREPSYTALDLVYRIQDSTITIVAIIHGKRLLENVSERFE